MFEAGQVIRARRTEVDKWMPGWYVKPQGDGHLVHLDGYGAREVSDDNIQCADSDVELNGHFYIFRGADGVMSMIHAPDRQQDFENALKQALGRELVARIDLTHYSIAVPKGYGLMPEKHLPKQESPRS